MTTAYSLVLRMKLYTWNKAIRVKPGEFELQ
jgi:hypothetical protein